MYTLNYSKSCQEIYYLSPPKYSWLSNKIIVLIKLPTTSQSCVLAAQIKCFCVSSYCSRLARGLHCLTRLPAGTSRISTFPFLPLITIINTGQSVTVQENYKQLKEKMQLCLEVIAVTAKPGSTGNRNPAFTV